MFNPSREEVHLFFDHTWAKGCRQEKLTAIEEMAFKIISQHPNFFISPSSDSEVAIITVNQKERETDQEVASYHNDISNIYLHLSLHLAVNEQLSINQPTGITLLYQSLTKQLQSAHQAQHVLINCLQSELINAQQHNRPLDNQDYLKNIATQLRKVNNFSL